MPPLHTTSEPHHCPAGRQGAGDHKAFLPFSHPSSSPQEKERLYLELKSILVRQPGPEAAEQLNLYQVGWLCCCSDAHPSCAATMWRWCQNWCCSIAPCSHLTQDCARISAAPLSPSSTALLPSTPPGHAAGEDQTDEVAGLGAQHVPGPGGCPVHMRYFDVCCTLPGCTTQHTHPPLRHTSRDITSMHEPVPPPLHPSSCPARCKSTSMR